MALKGETNQASSAGQDEVVGPLRRVGAITIDSFIVLFLLGVSWTILSISPDGSILALCFSYVLVPFPYFWFF